MHWAYAPEMLCISPSVLDKAPSSLRSTGGWTKLLRHWA
jgi:hypothetical protein